MSKGKKTGEQMIYKPFQDIELSRLGMGNMRLPAKEGTYGPNALIDWEKSQEIIDYAMASGINYYDTAYIYNDGESERFLGDALSGYPRDSYYLATKFYIQATPDPAPVFEEQLRRLKTDHIDFYLLHSLNEENVDDYLNSGCIDYFLEQQKAGRIRYFGFSSHANPETLRRFADHHQWDFAQLQLNYFDWQHGTAKDQYQILDERGIPIMVMEPVRGGRLADLTPDTNAQLEAKHPEWSIASWALRFVRDLPRVQVVLSGMSSMDQIIDNVKTFSDDDPLADDDRALLTKVCTEFQSQVQVPCTACRYCCSECPQEINIPEFLKIYNNYKVDGEWALMELPNVKTAGQPKDCIECGACASHCPQSIDIPVLMKALAEAADAQQ